MLEIQRKSSPAFKELNSQPMSLTVSVHTLQVGRAKTPFPGGDLEVTPTGGRERLGLELL